MKEEVKKSIGLFSEETLDSIAMAEVFGGADNCNGGNCVKQCGCSFTNSKAGCGPTVPINTKTCGIISVNDSFTATLEITSSPYISLEAGVRK